MGISSHSSKKKKTQKLPNGKNAVIFNYFTCPLIEEHIEKYEIQTHWATCRGIEEDTGRKCCVFGGGLFESRLVLCFVSSPQGLPLTVPPWGPAAVVCAETASQTTIPPNLR